MHHGLLLCHLGLYGLHYRGLPCLGRCVVPTIIVVLGSCVFRVIWVYTIFASVGTIASLYLLYPVSWTLTAGAEMVYFFYLYRKVFRNPAKPATV